jgi:hypothetical protein
MFAKYDFTEKRLFGEKLRYVRDFKNFSISIEFGYGQSTSGRFNLFSSVFISSPLMISIYQQFEFASKREYISIDVVRAFEPVIWFIRLYKY